MAKKITKKDIDQELLDALFTVEHEWKQVRSIVDKSIEPTMGGRYWEAVSQAKYLYLLREVRRRNLSAMEYVQK